VSAPLVVGVVCARPGCGHGEDLHDGICFGTACECVRFVAAAGALPMPVVSEPQASAGGYPPALPWAALMDDEDLHDFLDELAASAITHASNARALAEVEETCARWRLIAEAQHGHNTAPGPDAAGQSFAVRAGRESDPARRAAWRMLAEPEPEFQAWLHHENRVSHDLPETGGTR
jgi:hypothetical protein